jgi:UDP-N-acetyl-D-glucosamine/UDP-N-acetyl-D-galactosamine dehydrogenase
VKIAVVGLGYVGLPLAVAFAENGENVLGFDVSEKKVQQLKDSIDITNEIETERLKNVNLDYTNDPIRIQDATFIIVAVPTPITKAKTPDLSFIESAAKLIGKNLSKNSIVVLESTVYPGVTEDIMAPIIEKESGLKLGEDFKIGYSPERINPGDKEHTLEKVVKIVSGMDEECLSKIAEVYSKVAKAGVHKAPSIKVAEAAKVIENIQRDLNIGLMNELSIIFSKIGVRTKDVLDAAYTKWNFHRYKPGLVGGHCIKVDPFYLTYKAQELGYHPEMILSGRRVNDAMPLFVVDLLLKSMNEKAKVMIIGLSFKENVKDSRNSPAKEIIRELKKHNVSILGYDPLLTKDMILRDFEIESVDFEQIDKIDAFILCTGHDNFKNISLKNLKEKSNENPIIFDVRNFFEKNLVESEGFTYRSL